MLDPPGFTLCEIVFNHRNLNYSLWGNLTSCGIQDECCSGEETAAQHFHSLFNSQSLSHLLPYLSFLKFSTPGMVDRC